MDGGDVAVIVVGTVKDGACVENRIETGDGAWRRNLWKYGD